MIGLVPLGSFGLFLWGLYIVYVNQNAWGFLVVAIAVAISVVAAWFVRWRAERIGATRVEEWGLWRHFATQGLLRKEDIRQRGEKAYERQAFVELRNLGVFEKYEDLAKKRHRTVDSLIVEAMLQYLESEEAIFQHLKREEKQS